MRYQETWLLTIGTLGAALATSSSASTTGNNILEVVLVFPKNKTYKLQNDQTQNDTITLLHDLRWANWSLHDPYFAHNFLDGFNSSGRWNLAWSVSWQSCDEEGPSCPDPEFETAITINDTDKALSMRDFVDWPAADWTNNTCSVVAVKLVTPNPCRVEMDWTVVESMHASFTARRCQGFNLPDDCPKNEDDESAGVVLAGSGQLTLALSGAPELFGVM
ncbi:hypothetical protein BDW67DRAFT_177544 [Aspergillus spinulosporus]